MFQSERNPRSPYFSFCDACCNGFTTLLLPSSVDRLFVYSATMSDTTGIWLVSIHIPCGNTDHNRDCRIRCLALGPHRICLGRYNMPTSPVVQLSAVPPVWSIRSCMPAVAHYRSPDGEMSTRVRRLSPTRLPSRRRLRHRNCCTLFSLWRDYHTVESSHTPLSLCSVVGDIIYIYIYIYI